MANSSLIVAPETGGWGVVPTTGWRELEVLSDGHKTRTADSTYRGIRSGTGAPTSRNRRRYVEGGDGTIEVGGFSNGLGILNATVFETSSSVVHPDGEDAHVQTFRWGIGAAPTSKSVAVELRRLRKGTTTLDAYTHSGGRAVQMEVTCDVDGNLGFKYVMDYKNVVRQPSLPARTIAEVEPDVVYNWRDATITIAGEPVCIKSFGLTLPTGIDVDDKCMIRDDNRHVPTRKGTPAPTGTMQWDYGSPEFYDAFINAEELALEATWLGPVAIEGEDEDAIFPGLTISLGAICFSGDSPEISIEEATKQALPFDILDNETDYVVEMVNVTSDAAL